MRKIIFMSIAIISLLALAIPIFAGGAGVLSGRGSFNYVPSPQLIFPLTDDIELMGKDFLEFKWILKNIVNLRYYDFRLYKGYNTYADNLILKEQIPSDSNSFQIKASTFEVGQVYTWVLKAVSLSGVKSDPSYSPFKIIKK